MAVIVRNRLFVNRFPGGAITQVSFNNNGNTGINNKLIIVVISPATTCSSINYGGVNMTKKYTTNTAYTTYIDVFELQNPPTGTKNANIFWNAGQYNQVSINIFSFDDCDGLGTTALNNTQAVNQSVNINISQDSLIHGHIISGNSTSAYIQIPNGTARSLFYTPHNINNRTWASSTGTTTYNAGTYNVIGGSTATNITFAFEVKSVPSAPTSRRRSILV